MDNDEAEKKAEEILFEKIRNCVSNIGSLKLNVKDINEALVEGGDIFFKILKRENFLKVEI